MPGDQVFVDIESQGILVDCRRLQELLGNQEWKLRHLLMIDVDYFKKYNDTYGHLAGDEVLKQIAKAIQQSTQRPADLVARFGGEEFVVVLPATPADGMRCRQH